MAIISERIEGTQILVEIKSSNIKSAKYDTESKTATITFNSGGIYEYYDLSWETFTKFRMSESQGKFLNTLIKDGKHKFKKIN